MSIKFFGLDRQYQNLREEILEITDSVLSTGQVLDGVYVNRFEKEMARRCGRRHAIAVNSGTQALMFAQDVHPTVKLEGQSEKVLIPGVSFVATLNSVVMSGNSPVFCDVNDRAHMDLANFDIALTGAGITTVMYVNIFGNCLDYDELKLICSFFNPHQGIKIIEDAAQSFGASYKGRPSGSLGDISILSFDPTKNLNNYGSGGMLLTDHDEVAVELRDRRGNGRHSGYIMPGTNSKMSEVDCAQMLIKLEHFDAWQRRRTEIAEYYIEHLSAYVDIILPLPDTVSSWHKFVIRPANRTRLINHLRDHGVETKIHYDTPLHEHTTAYGYHDRPRHLPYSEAHCAEALSLPIYPELTDAEVEHIVKTVQTFKW
jgi:dTDP-4-amino-4,6-dideoxygalactose transaminase